VRLSKGDKIRLAACDGRSDDGDPWKIIGMWAEWNGRAWLGCWRWHPDEGLSRWEWEPRFFAWRLVHDDDPANIDCIAEQLIADGSMKP
jgi:hypothetical protein